MNDTEIDSALQAEYFHLQTVIEDFDSKAIGIKAWSISFSLAAIVGAFAGKSSLVLFVAFISTLLFWLLEAIWKSFQLGYYERSATIERHFNGEQTLDAPFQIGNAWFRHWHAGGSRAWAKLLLWPHVALPHAVVALIGGLLFLLSVLGKLGQ